MQNSLQVLKNKQFGEMHGYISNDTVFLNLGDVARGLGFIKADGDIRSRAINRLLKKAGYTKKFNAKDYVPESVFYFLAMRADSPNAEGFQKWLACDVVPQIRQTGSYSVKNAAPALPSSDIRRSNISVNKSFRSVIQLFIFYAQSQGDTRAKEKIYAKFMSVANKVSDIQNGNRPKSDDEKQIKCKMAENLMGDILLKGMQAEKHFATIESEAYREVGNLSRYFAPTLPLLE